MKVRSWSRNWPKLHKKSEFWSSFGVSFPPAAENRRSLTSRGVGIAGFRPHPRGIECSIRRHDVSIFFLNLFNFTCFYFEKWVNEGWWNWIRSYLIHCKFKDVFFVWNLYVQCAMRRGRNMGKQSWRFHAVLQMGQTIPTCSWKKIMTGGAFYEDNWPSWYWGGDILLWTVLEAPHRELIRLLQTPSAVRYRADLAQSQFGPSFLLQTMWLKWSL